MVEMEEKGVCKNLIFFPQRPLYYNFMFEKSYISVNILNFMTTCNIRKHFDVYMSLILFFSYPYDKHLPNAYYKGKKKRESSIIHRLKNFFLNRFLIRFISQFSLENKWIII